MRQANLFHGEVVNIRDVVTFQGQSVDELRQALADSVEDYLPFCAERGEAPDPPFSERYTVQLSPEQHRKVILAAEKAGKDVAQWVIETLEQATEPTGHVAGHIWCVAMCGVRRASTRPQRSGRLAGAHLRGVPEGAMQTHPQL